MYDEINKEDNDLSVNKNLCDLLYYNIVFHYHNEPIELLTYYLENLRFLFNNMIKQDNLIIEFSINFFISDLNSFVKLLINKKYISNFNFNKIKHKIYENKTNLIETNYIKIKPNNYNFEIIIHEILSKPNKNVSSSDYNNIFSCQKLKNNNIECDFGTKTKIDKTKIIDGSKSIGFKRYVANIMSWNIYEKLVNNNKQEKIFNQIKTFLFQIDFGTIIGLHILLHNSIDNNLINKDVLSEDNFNYLYETKQFLSSNNSITDSYSIDSNLSNKPIETLFSKQDFYYFVNTHLITVIQNFNIVHFTTLSIKESKKIIKSNNIIINTIPNKPKNYFNEYYKLNKSHYDKFYITDIGLTYLYEDNISKPITYNKNYTSFSEDLLYTSLLYKLKKLILPHPFLNITKCSYKLLNNKKEIKEEKYELIYIFMPLDDVGNNKIFDIQNYIGGKKHDTRPIEQNDEINKLKNNFKTKLIDKNLIQTNNIYNDLENNKAKLIDKNKIECGIQNKTNTKLYINKYSNSKIVFDIFNKNILNHFKTNILLNYNNLLVVFDTNTNKNYYHKIMCDVKTRKIIEYYNNKYNFHNDSKYKILKSSIELKYSNNNSIDLISQFVLDYTLNFLEIKRIVKKISNEIVSKTLNELSNVQKEKISQNNELITNYEKKYLKYKLKYLELKTFQK